MALSDQDDDLKSKTAEKLMIGLGSKRFKAPNPNPINKDGTSACRAEVHAVRWDDIEPLLLANASTEMERCRIVTVENHYKGDLAKMLFLFDHDVSPYLPGAAKYDFLMLRLKQRAARKKNARPPPTLFEKLNITMPVNGVTQIAKISTHDPRRWLTTMALTYGEKLSNVLINKWAKASNLSTCCALTVSSSSRSARFFASSSPIFF